MFLSAYVKDKETKQYSVMTQEDYTSKESFRKDLVRNGYSVTRISNKRDLAAQDHNYESFTEMKKNLEFYNENPELWKNEIELIKEIKNIEL